MTGKHVDAFNITIKFELSGLQRQCPEAGTKPTIQVVTYKRACYLKPVVASRVAPLTVDKFGGLQLTWSRFGGSLRSTMEWIDQSTVWDWAAELQAVAD